MKKVIVGLAALAAVVALRPVLKRRMAQKMQAHCKQMASKCKEMMASQTAGRGEPTGTGDHQQPKAPQFVGHEEAVGAA